MRKDVNGVVEVRLKNIESILHEQANLIKELSKNIEKINIEMAAYIEKTNYLLHQLESEQKERVMLSRVIFGLIVSLLILFISIIFKG